jgi:chorismate mutase
MEIKDELDQLRKELLEHDLGFIAMLSDRQKIVAAIGAVKTMQGSPVLQSDAFYKMQEKRIVP